MILQDAWELSKRLWAGEDLPHPRCRQVGEMWHPSYLGRQLLQWLQEYCSPVKHTGVMGWSWRKIYRKPLVVPLKSWISYRFSLHPSQGSGAHLTWHEYLASCCAFSGASFGSESPQVSCFLSRFLILKGPLKPKHWRFPNFQISPASISLKLSEWLSFETFED